MISYNKNCKKNHHMGQEAGEKEKRKKEKGIKMGPAPLWKRKGFLTLGTPFSSGRIAMTEREFQRLWGEYSSWFAAGSTERDQHRGSWPPCCTPQPEMHICWCMWGLGAKTQALVDRPGERSVVGCVETPWRGWRMVQTEPMGVCRTESEFAIEAPLLMCAKWGVGPHHSSHSWCAHKGTTPPLWTLGVLKCWWVAHTQEVRLKSESTPDDHVPRAL